jgi:hypothetical protein
VALGWCSLTYTQMLDWAAGDVDVTSSMQLTRSFNQ